MLNAISLCHLRRRKKKTDEYIISPQHFAGRVFHIPVESPEILKPNSTENAFVERPNVSEPLKILPDTNPDFETVQSPIVSQPVSKAQNEISSIDNGVKVSAFSLASIRAKKEIQQQRSSAFVEEENLPKEVFTENDMLVQWVKYANRLGDKGQKIMESLLMINDPKLDGTIIIHELPNESSKHDFENEKRELLGYLRGKLHNHDIDIKVIVNESIDTRKAFTPQDRYNRLNELNPNLDKLRRLFDLDF